MSKTHIQIGDMASYPWEAVTVEQDIVDQPLFEVKSVATFNITTETRGDTSGTITRFAIQKSRNFREWLMRGVAENGTPVLLRQRWITRQPRRLARRAKKRRHT